VKGKKAGKERQVEENSKCGKAVNVSETQENNTE
jgi:hypothetical protein